MAIELATDAHFDVVGRATSFLQVRLVATEHVRFTSKLCKGPDPIAINLRQISICLG